MPPLKEYRFGDLENPNIEIIIKAYSLVRAFEFLVSITKNPADFKCTSV